MPAPGFSAATYNILADAYVKPGRYPHSPPAALEPGTRRQRLLARVSALAVDLLCLQEVEPAAHAAIAGRLGDEYVGVYAPRRGRPDGASLFVRSGPLALVGHEVMHYRSHARGDDQVALLGLLRFAGQRLIAASTHLQWCSEDTPAEQHIGRAQLVELLDRTERDADAIWILAGDFNATADSAVLRAATGRGMALAAAGQRPWDTCNANGRPRKLDYLLYSEGRLDPRPGPLPPLRGDTPMPSLVEPSDHLPLRVEFTARASG